MKIESKLRAMGFSLPSVAEPAGNYVRAVRAGHLVFLAGSIARGENGVIKGRLGESITLEEAYEGARLAVLNLLAALKGEIGDLDNVRRIVKLLCFVQANSNFPNLPKVANGASDLLTTLYGEAGRHARSTVGVNTLGGGSCVEVEMIVEVE